LFGVHSVKISSKAVYRPLIVRSVVSMAVVLDQSVPTTVIWYIMYSPSSVQKDLRARAALDRLMSS
jgi:hypothetical protein